MSKTRTSRSAFSLKRIGAKARNNGAPVRTNWFADAAAARTVRLGQRRHLPAVAGRHARVGLGIAALARAGTCAASGVGARQTIVACDDRRYGAECTAAGH